MIEFLGVAALTAVGFAIGGSIGATVMASIGINLSSNVIEAAKTHLKEKWLNGSDGILNHDIQQSLIRAFVKALNYLETTYFAAPEASTLPVESQDAIRRFFKDLRADAGKMFPEPDDQSAVAAEIRRTSSVEPDAAQKRLWSQINDAADVRLLNEQFKSFLSANLLDQVVQQFGEELKADTKAGNRAWQAFQRLLLEGIRTEVRELNTGQALMADNLRKAIDDGFAKHKKPLKGVAIVVGRIDRGVTDIGRGVNELTSKIDRIAATTGESVDELLKESCELSNRREHERADEVARKAASIARRLKDGSLERRCLVHEGDLLFAAAAAEKDALAIRDRLQLILREFDRLGRDTYHHLSISLQLSRILRNHDETVTTSRVILGRADAPIRLQVDALSALTIALGCRHEMDGAQPVGDRRGDVHPLHVVTKVVGLAQPDSNPRQQLRVVFGFLDSIHHGSSARSLSTSSVRTISETTPS